MNEEVKNWECEICSFLNPNEKDDCIACGNEKAEGKNLVEQKQEKKKENDILISPVLFLEILKGKVMFSEDAGNELLQTFDHEKALIIIISAGQVGTGKSTWMNSLIYELTKEDKSKTTFANFSIGHGNKSHTEGLWIYPYAFKLEKYPDLQFMLCDMEGMGGLKDEDDKILDSALKKLYTFGLVLASNFLLHSHKRPDKYTITTLNESYSVLKRLINLVKFDPPKIYLTVKDSKQFNFQNENDKPQENDVEQFKNILRNKNHVDSEIFQYFNVLPKPKPPSVFLEALEKGDLPNDECFKFLQNSDYSQFNSNFIEISSINIKKVPYQNNNLNLKSFLQLSKEVSTSINSSCLEDFFLEKMENVLTIKLEETLKQQFNEYQLKSMKIVEELTSFDDNSYFLSLATIKTDNEQLFLQKIKESFPEIDPKTKCFENAFSKFQSMLSQHKETELRYFSRKITNIQLNSQNQLNILQSQLNANNYYLQNYIYEAGKKSQEFQNKIAEIEKLKNSQILQYSNQINSLQSQISKLNSDIDYMRSIARVYGFSG